MVKLRPAALIPTPTAARRALGAVPSLPRRGARLVGQVVPAGAPRPLVALERYRSLAHAYDGATATGEPYRRQTVETLAPLPGETVVEVGCGTGLNFELVQRGIGSGGRLLGVDPSPEMLEHARARVREHGWENVLLLEASAEEVRLPALADAALLCGVHDVMRSPPALANVVRQVRPGGRVVAGGPKWVPWWQPGSVALNVSTWTLNRDYVTTFEGFDRPWSHLAALVRDLRVESVCLGTGYIARGRRP
jgi:SAM-dependent methyltransferase